MAALLDRFRAFLVQNLSAFFDALACLDRSLCGLGRRAAGKLQLRSLVLNHHSTLGVTHQVAGGHLKVADQRAGSSAGRELEHVDRAGAVVERGVRAVAQLGAGLGLHVHTGPDDAGVQVDAQALCRRSVKGLANVCDQQVAAIVHRERIKGDKAVGLLDHAGDIRLLDHEADDPLPVGREHRKVDLAKIF